jgi:hypothetical protein
MFIALLEYAGAAPPAEFVIDDRPGDDDADRDGLPAPGAPARRHAPMVTGQARAGKSGRLDTA